MLERLATDIRSSLLDPLIVVKKIQRCEYNPWSRIHIQHFIFFLTYKWAQQARVIVPGKPFQPSLMFLSKARAYHSEVPSTLEQAPCLPTNIRLGWKGLPVTDTLAYSAQLCVTKKMKCFEHNLMPSQAQLFQYNTDNLWPISLTSVD